MNVSFFLVAYLVGSIPFALWLTRRSGGTDVRRVGSGNIGTTNVWRVAGAATAVAVFTLDVGKGLAVVLGAREVGLDLSGQATSAAAVVAGQVFPVWLKFRGGKGVATAAGAFLVLTPWAMLITAGIFVSVVWISRFMSIGSIAAGIALVPLVFISGVPPPVLTAVCGVSLLVVTRHRSNVTRLLAGSERRVGQRA